MAEFLRSAATEDTGFAKPWTEQVSAINRWKHYVVLAEALKNGVDLTDEDLIHLGYGLFRDKEVNDGIEAGTLVDPDSGDAAEPIVDDVSHFLSSVDRPSAERIAKLDSVDQEILQTAAVMAAVVPLIATVTGSAAALGTGYGVVTATGNAAGTTITAAGTAARAAAAAATAAQGRVVAGSVGGTTWRVISQLSTRTQISNFIGKVLRTQAGKWAFRAGVVGALSTAFNLITDDDPSYVDTMTEEDIEAAFSASDVAGFVDALQSELDSDPESRLTGWLTMEQINEIAPGASPNQLSAIATALGGFLTTEGISTIPPEPLDKENVQRVFYQGAPGDDPNFSAPIGGYSAPRASLSAGTRGDARAGLPFDDREGRAPTYFHNDQIALFVGLSPNRVAEIQADMVTAGIINVNAIRDGGVWDNESASAAGTILAHANRHGIRWQDALQELKENPLPPDDNALGIEPFERKSYLAPDYATLAQRVRDEFQAALGRKPRQSEMVLLSRQLEAEHRDAFGVEQAAAESAYNAGVHVLREGGTDQESADAAAAAGGFRSVDPVSRFREAFLSKYGAEIDRQSDVEATRERAVTMSRGLAGLTNMVRR